MNSLRNKRTVELAAWIYQPAVVLPGQVWLSMPNGPLLSVGDDAWSVCPSHSQPD